MKEYKHFIYLKALIRNDKGKSEKDMANKHGLMEQNMKDIGRIIKQMVKENFGISMVMSMKVNSLCINFI